MAFWVYMLRCADSTYYTGHTDDLERRIGEHMSGLFAGYTSRRLPVRLAFSQEFSTREEALRAELQIKKWSRTKKEALIQSDWGRISTSAKKRFKSN